MAAEIPKFDDVRSIRLPLFLDKNAQGIIAASFVKSLIGDVAFYHDSIGEVILITAPVFLGNTIVGEKKFAISRNVQKDLTYRSLGFFETRRDKWYPPI